MNKVIVVGAGFSGALIARAFSDAGWKVTVLEKSRGYGGRMATRRLECGSFNHGAPTIDVSKELIEFLGSAVTEIDQTWRGRPGMSAIARQLLKGIDVQFETTVQRVGADGRLTAQSPHQANTVFEADLVVCTPPLPQVSALFDRPTVACYNVIATGLVQSATHPSVDGWQARLDSPNHYVLSRVVLDRDHATAALDDLQSQLGPDLVATHFWRYAQVLQTEDELYWLEGQRAACGDGFGDPSWSGSARAEHSVRALLQAILG